MKIKDINQNFLRIYERIDNDDELCIQVEIEISGGWINTPVYLTPEQVKKVIKHLKRVVKEYERA